MRSFLRATLLAVLLGIMTPGVAFCQLPDDDFDDHFDAPPPPKATKKPAARKRWSDSPLSWGVGTMVLAVAIPLGVWKTIGHFRTSVQQQGRPKAAWEQDPPPPAKL